MIRSLENTQIENIIDRVDRYTLSSTGLSIRDIEKNHGELLDAFSAPLTGEGEENSLNRLVSNLYQKQQQALDPDKIDPHGFQDSIDRKNLVDALSYRFREFSNELGVSIIDPEMSAHHDRKKDEIFRDNESRLRLLSAMRELGYEARPVIPASQTAHETGVGNGNRWSDDPCVAIRDSESDHTHIISLARMNEAPESGAEGSQPFMSHSMSLGHEEDQFKDHGVGVELKSPNESLVIKTLALGDDLDSITKSLELHSPEMRPGMELPKKQNDMNHDRHDRDMKTGVSGFEM